MTAFQLNRGRMPFSCLLILLALGIISGCTGKSDGNSGGSAPSGAINAGSSNNAGGDISYKVEQAIAQNLPKEIGVPIQSVSCPDQVLLAAGTSFDCDAKIAQGRFPVKVTVKDAQGNLNFRTKQILLLSEAETKLQQSIKKSEKLDVKADCGGKVKLFKKVGEKFQCKLKTTDGKTGTATITPISEEGKVDAKWKI